jgi:hypothetical protein
MSLTLNISTTINNFDPRILELFQELNVSLVYEQYTNISDINNRSFVKHITIVNNQLSHYFSET